MKMSGGSEAVGKLSIASSIRNEQKEENGALARAEFLLSQRVHEPGTQEINLTSLKTEACPEEVPQHRGFASYVTMEKYVN